MQAAVETAEVIALECSKRNSSAASAGLLNGDLKAPYKHEFSLTTGQCHLHFTDGETSVEGAVSYSEISIKHLVSPQP